MKTTSSVSTAPSPQSSSDAAASLPLSSAVTPPLTTAATALSTPTTTGTTTGTTGGPHHHQILLKSVRKALQKQTLNFAINVECTSLRLSPSGNFLWGGFSDGTLRVFDLSGTFDLHQHPPQQGVGTNTKNGNSGTTTTTTTGAASFLLNSKHHQSYGAVACQIHARGVHTDLITTVDIAPDGKYVFCGVSRGAMELYAVHVEALEEAVLQAAAQQRRQRKQHQLQQQRGGGAAKKGSSTSSLLDSQQQSQQQKSSSLNMLDYIQVFCYADAKLKGFGACTSMMVMNENGSSIAALSSPSYLLLTGKGIKNIHIWKFTPPPPLPPTNGSTGNSTAHASLDEDAEDGVDDDHENDNNGSWEQLYDTSTNGNTIVLLSFYRTPQGKLLAVSKSDVQKLRLWDLSMEEQQQFSTTTTTPTTTTKRPKRPPYQDVDNSHAALGIAGGYCVCGGDSMYNELSIVKLDQPNNAYNHSELALPSSNNETTTAVASSSSSPTFGASGGGSSSRRQRRGEMKAVVNVATSSHDSSHALLELDDGSLVQYSAGVTDSQRLPTVKFATPESTGMPALPAEFWSRSLCLENIAGVTIAATSLYNPNTNKGKIAIRAIEGIDKLKQKASRDEAAAVKIAPPSAPRSPVAADTQALQHAVQAPPASLSKKKKKKHPKRQEDAGRRKSPGGKPALSQERAAKESSVRVSPDKAMVTPIRPPASTGATPESLGGLQALSDMLQTHQNPSSRINVVAPSTEKVNKKRKKEMPQENLSAGKKRPSKKVKTSQQVPSERLKLLKKEYQAMKLKPKNISNPQPDQETAFFVNTTATIPIATSTPAAFDKKKRKLVVEEPLSDVDTAMLLARMKSPAKDPIQSIQKSIGTTSAAHVVSTSACSLKPNVDVQQKTQQDRSAKTAAKLTSPKPSGQNQAARDAFLRERVAAQYSQLRQYLRNLTKKSGALLHTRNLRGPTLSFAASSPSMPQQKYQKLLEEHRAAHDSLEKRLLRSAETTLHLLLDDDIAADEARADLKASIKRFEEILYDVLHRQQLEMDAFLAQHRNLQRTTNPSSNDPYPCQPAFSKVEEICGTITRPVGRPKTVVSPTL